MEDWGIQVLQFVWFKDETEGLRASSIFHLITGDEAENTQTNKTPGPGGPFQSLASTSLDDRHFQVMVGPGRIDYTVARPDRPSAGPWAWKLADGLKILDVELKRAQTASEKIGPANRVALVTTLLRNVGSAKEASKFVIDRIGGNIAPSAIDLMVQLNIQKKSMVTKGQLNRLMRFGSASVQEMTMTIVNGRASPSAAGPERHIASLLLDLNTPPGVTIFSPAQVSALFAEFAVEATALAVNGTVEGLQK